MASIAVIFESRYGQSEKIAEHIGDGARRHGHSARVAHASLLGPETLTAHDGVVVVAPIYVGRHPRTIQELLAENAAVLRGRPCALVSVSNSAAGGPAARAAAQARADDLARATGITPLVVTTAGGALAYPRYGLLVRAFMKLIARREGDPIDTTRVHELTDWVALDASLEPFFATPELAASPPPAGSARTWDSGIHPLGKIRRAAGS